MKSDIGKAIIMASTVHQKVPARNGRKPNFPSIGRQLLSVRSSHRLYWLNIGSDLINSPTAMMITRNMEAMVRRNITCPAILSFAIL